MSIPPPERKNHSEGADDIPPDSFPQGFHSGDNQKQPSPTIVSGGNSFSAPYHSTSIDPIRYPDNVGFSSQSVAPSQLPPIPQLTQSSQNNRSEHADYIPPFPLDNIPYSRIHSEDKHKQPSPTVVSGGNSLSAPNHSSSLDPIQPPITVYPIQDYKIVQPPPRQSSNCCPCRSKSNQIKVKQCRIQLESQRR